MTRSPRSNLRFPGFKCSSVPEQEYCCWYITIDRYCDASRFYSTCSAMLDSFRSFRGGLLIYKVSCSFPRGPQSSIFPTSNNMPGRKSTTQRSTRSKRARRAPAETPPRAETPLFLPDFDKTPSPPLASSSRPVSFVVWIVMVIPLRVYSSIFLLGGAN